MAIQKKGEQSSFILYYDSISLIEKLSDEEAGLLLKAIFQYKVHGEIPQLNPAADMAFTAIQNYLDRDAESYRDKCQKNAENGRKGGLTTQKRARQEGEANQANARNALTNQGEGSEIKRGQANQADSDSDNDNDSDSDLKANRKRSKQMVNRKNSFHNFDERDNDYESIQNELIKKGMQSVE